MSNLWILGTAAGIFIATTMAESLTAEKYYRPDFCGWLETATTILVLAGTIWAPLQEFSEKERFLLILDLMTGIYAMMVYSQNRALRRAAINQEHYESLRSGIEKI